MYLIPTDSCNFKCSYCFIEGNFSTNKRSALKFNEAQKWIDYMFNNSEGEIRFIFYGGEPLLNQSFIKNSIEYIHNKQELPHKIKKVNIAINTNGSVYNKTLSDLFRKAKVSLSISVDGPRELHDKCRRLNNGGPTFDTVTGNIDRYLADNVSVSLSMTITKYNLNYLPQIAKWVVDNYKGRINGVGFNPLISTDNTDKNYINENDFGFVMLQIYNAFRIFKQYGIYEDRVMRRLTKIIDGTPHIKDCAGCGNQIVVGADGKIGPCQAFLGSGEFFKFSEPRHYTFSKDNVINEWHNISPLNKKTCNKCPFILICGNGCPYYAKNKTGKLMGLDRRYCSMMPVMINEVMKDNFYKKPKALFLDYDNTIIIRSPLNEIFNKIGQKFGVTYSTSPKGFFNPVDYFKENGVREHDMKAIINEYSTLWKGGATPNHNLLKQLQTINLPKYILTNSNGNMVKEELERFGISNLFKGVFGGEIYPKPSKDFYLHAFSSTGLQPEEIVYIGDSKLDIMPIYAFGVRTVLFSPYGMNNLFDNNWLIDLCI